MTDTVRYPLVLGLICLFSAGGLALSYSLTRDEIRRQEQLKKDRGLAEVFGIQLDERATERPWKELPAPSGRAEGEGAFSVFIASDPKKEGGHLYAAEGAKRGYSSKVEVIVAVDQGIKDDPKAARIRVMRVVNQSETPGLGTRSTELEFQRQFRNLLLGKLDLRKNVPYRDPESPESDTQEIAAITGATITSNAVIGAVRQALDRIHARVAEGQGAAPAPDPRSAPK